MDNLGGGLRTIDWSTHKLEHFEKNFYVEDKRVSSRSDREIEDFRRSKEMKVSSLSFFLLFFTIYISSLVHLPHVQGRALPGFPDYIMSTIRAQGFAGPTPIQCQAWAMGHNAYTKTHEDRTGGYRKGRRGGRCLVEQRNTAGKHGPFSTVFLSTHPLHVTDRASTHALRHSTGFQDDDVTLPVPFPYNPNPTPCPTFSVFFNHACFFPFLSLTLDEVLKVRYRLLFNVFISSSTSQQQQTLPTERLHFKRPRELPLRRPNHSGRF